jgi:hypothetical protein
MEARDLPIDLRKVFATATVDSREFKTAVAGSPITPAWIGAHFEFPLLVTSQQLIIQLWDKKVLGANRYLGRAVVMLRDIATASASREPASPATPGPITAATTTSSSAVGRDSKTVGSDIVRDPEEKAPSLTAWFEIDVSSSSQFDEPPSTSSASTPVATPASPTSAALGPTPRPSERKATKPAIFITTRLATELPRDTGAAKIEVVSTNTVADGVRHLVSKKKKRWQQDGFDLDLTYITDRIIAMGFPSTALEGVYRNNLLTMRRFFNKRHAKAYKIYNLCSERSYPDSTFTGPVIRYPFADHNACPFEMIPRYTHTIPVALVVLHD